MINSVDAYVGLRLQTMRKELGLSQDRIGKMAGITFQQIQKYEKGQNRIGSSRLYELSKILNVPVSYFFEGYEETIKGTKANSKTDTVYNSLPSKEIVSLVKNFSCISSKEVRKRISGLIASLKD